MLHYLIQFIGQKLIFTQKQLMNILPTFNEAN